MIDAENKIALRVSDAIYQQYPDAYVTDEKVIAPPAFPCVSIVEISNTTHQGSLTNELRENHADVVYEIEIFSNRVDGKRAECRALASVVDLVLLSLNFTRTMLEPINNFADATIARMVGRYRATIGSDLTIYRR